MSAIWRALEEQSLNFVRASVTVRPNCPIASSVRIDLALPSRSTLTFRTVSASLSCANLGLKGRVFSCLDLPKGVAKRADFRRQVSEIRQHVFLRQIDFRQHGLSHRCNDVFGKTG